MSKAVREALWAREKAERAAVVKPRPRRVETFTAAPKVGWAVVRVNDDGRRQVVSTGLTPEQAERSAGIRRDRMPDDEVGEGWNYLPEKVRGGKVTRG